jgi:outer membrane biosynthesis protein TonB
MSGQPRDDKKVLRIGIILDGKIVQERLIKAGDSVTVGESAKNTFVFPKTQLPKAEFTLFTVRGSKYYLQLTQSMRGKISSRGSVQPLDAARQDPTLSKQDGNILVPLSPDSRGKIGVDGVTVLFQFVAPPPARTTTAIRGMDFRPKMMDDDDPVFLGFLAIWSALALVFMIYVMNTDPPEFQLEELPDRFTKMVIKKKDKEKVEKKEEKKEEKIDEKAKAPEKEEKAKAEPKKEKSKKEKVDDAKRLEKAKEDVLKKSKLLVKIIGTTGQSSGGVLANVWSGDDSGMKNLDLAGAGGITTDASEALRTGSGGKGEAADIGDIGGVGGGTAELGGGPAVQLEAEVSVGEGEADMLSGDQSAVKKTVRRYSGQLKYCYEQRLKANPDLEGRVSLTWTVGAGGAVTEVYVEGNTTGDSQLASCMEKKVKRWKFPADVEGDISWPFVFRAKN